MRQSVWILRPSRFPKKEGLERRAELKHNPELKHNRAAGKSCDHGQGIVKGIEMGANLESCHASVSQLNRKQAAQALKRRRNR
jgi:hypothetical protein